MRYNAHRMVRAGHTAAAGERASCSSLLALCALLAGCVFPQVAAREALLALPRSSVSAVLDHRFDLELSAEQVVALERIDARLAERNAELRARLAPPEDAFRPGMAPQAPRPHAPPNSTPFDDNDTAAYLEAEQVLSETQRPVAREIATRYRGDRFDARKGIRRAAQPATAPAAPPPPPPAAAPDIPAGSML